MGSLAPTYRPSYTPPEVKKKEPVQVKVVDVSSVEVGTIVMHKAFGPGRVIKLESGYISIEFYEFDNRIKLFPFPGAFNDGFLSCS